MAELADALRSGRSELTLVWVQVPLAAPRQLELLDEKLQFCFNDLNVGFSDLLTAVRVGKQRVEPFHFTTATLRAPDAGRAHCALFDLYYFLCSALG